MDAILAFAQRLPPNDLVALLLVVLAWLWIVATRGPRWLKWFLVPSTAFYAYRLPVLLGYSGQALMSCSITLFASIIIVSLMLPPE